MVSAKRLLLRCFALIISLIFLFPYTCYAVDTDYLSGDSIEEIYWSDCKNIININNDDLIGNIKYIPDSENSCFYIRISFHSTADDYAAEKVRIGFTVSNSVNSYRFAVKNTGENGELITENDDNFKIYYSFDLYPSKRRGGYIYIGFDFKNKTDKTLNNTIGCEYSCGDNCVYNLFDDVSMDMYKPTSRKSTTTKKSKSKTTTKSSKSTTVKSKSSSKTTSKKSSQTKYAGSNLYKAGQTVQESETETEFNFENFTGSKTDEDETASTPLETQLSDTAKRLLIAAAVIAAIGVAAIIIGVVTKPTDVEHNESEE